MNASLVLMSKLISMMIVAAVGLITIRIGLLDERDRRQLAKLSLYVLQPCLIISSFQIELTPERLKGFGLAVIFAGLIHAGFIAAAELLVKIGLLDVVEELTVIYTNCGNLILPIGAFIFVLFCTTKAGWGWDAFVAEADTGKGLKVKKWMRPLFTFLMPVLIVIILVAGLI